MAGEREMAAAVSRNGGTRDWPVPAFTGKETEIAATARPAGTPRPPGTPGIPVAASTGTATQARPSAASSRSKA